MDKYLYIAHADTCDGLLVFASVSKSQFSWCPSCVTPEKYYTDLEPEALTPPYRKSLSDYTKVDSSLVDSLKETVFIRGTVMSNRSVIKDTAKNRRTLGLPLRKLHPFK